MQNKFLIIQTKFKFRKLLKLKPRPKKIFARSGPLWSGPKIRNNRRKPHSCTTQRHQALETRWPGLLLQADFFRSCKTTRVPFPALVWRARLSRPLWPLRGINKTAWGAKLILTAGLAYPVSCAGLGHLLMAGHCPLGSLPRLRLPTRPPHPLPTRPPPIDSIRVITGVEKNHLKNQGHTNS